MPQPRATNIVDSKVGANLRLMRQAAGMSQQRLGDETGVTFQQIQKYERGANRIGASRLWRLCEIFEVQPNAFYEGVGAVTDLTDSKDTVLMEFYQHVRGGAAAQAFLALKNPDVEKQIIGLMRAQAQSTTTEV